MNKFVADKIVWKKCLKNIQKENKQYKPEIWTDVKNERALQKKVSKDEIQA